MSRLPRVLLSGAVLGQPMGGVRRHNAELLPRAGRLLAEGGGQLAVLEGRTPPAFELPSCVERLPSRVPAGPPIARALHEGAALRRALARAARRGEPFDLVHTAHLPAPLGLPLPMTLTLHDLRSLELRHTPFSRRFVASRVLGAALARAACTIAVSETVRARLALDFSPRRLAVVPNAADHLPYQRRTPDREPFLLCVGHLEPRKNCELLLLALAADPALPPVLFAGAEKRGARARLEARARQLGVAARARFAGAVDDRELARLYARCACVVLPSRLEGFGIPALEAQRAGAPVAVARAGALPEVAGEGVPSFHPDDAAECSRAIHRALATTRAELEGFELRARRYHWDGSAQLLVEIWREAAVPE